tara:strand:+ start:577 stop:1704 length:1128 start_codon:yes stop_codon:yes gene_type:complete
MKKRILFITTIYRVGEKVFPVIPELVKTFDVDVFNMYQMSSETPWVGTIDPRKKLYELWSRICGNVFNGPTFVLDTDTNAGVYGKFVQKINSVLGDIHYDLILVDNNITIKGGHVNEIYKYFKSRGIKVIACPHANREYRGYKVLKRIGGHYDYSFVFGQKEKDQLPKSMSKYAKHKDRLLLGGIPSNDALNKYKLCKKYILVIPNITDYAHKGGQTRAIPFTKKTFEKLDLERLASKYECDIVIKEKNRLFFQTSVFQEAMKPYKNVHFVMDCKDDNQLISDAICVVGSPGTLMFKSIQLGIPTVLLKKHGQIGNFYDYQGFIEEDYKMMVKEFDRQKKEGKEKKFIKNTLTGGIDFSSTQKYVDHISNFLKLS